jgi:osmotically-inducible protein OsmY
MTETIFNSDVQLKTTVDDELSYIAGIGADRLVVAANDGVVTISGDTASLPERHAARQAAMRVFGAKAVTDAMVVRNPDAHEVKDTDIAEMANRMLDWAVDVPAGAVKAMAHDHVITLSGTVARNDQRTAAARSVMYLRGVTGITNSITLNAPAPTSDAKATIEAALRRSAQFHSQSITVHIDGAEVTLRGNVRSWNERRQAEGIAWAAAGVSKVKNELAFTA